MSETYQIKDRATIGSSYFFLSYAHSPPLAGSLHADPDQWVRRFFEDLTAAVRRLALAPTQASGFFDQDLPLFPGWKASLTHALSTAEVFVPLLSPGYYTRSWPGREWACFDQRLADAGLTRSERQRRFAPVLWIPVPGDQDRWPGLREALALGGGETPYAENGLRALLRLAPYRASYQSVVERLAGQIAFLAEAAPLAPSSAPPFGDIPSAFEPTPDAARFAVAVAAPKATDLPFGRDSAGYAERGVAWRAYPDDQELPLAEYAAQIAEQLDFAVMVAGIEDPHMPVDDQPGIVLIDPWLAANERGADAFAEYVRRLPSWVLPLLVLDPDAGQRGNELADRIRDILGQSAVRTDPASYAVRGVRSLKEFVTLMPILVTEAGRQFLRRSPDAAAASQGGRFWPRLTAGPAGGVNHSEGPSKEHDA
jgi:FxsC-like protein